MTQRENTPARAGAPMRAPATAADRDSVNWFYPDPLAQPIRDELNSQAAQAIRDALQIVQLNIVQDTDPEPWAQLDRDAIDSITGRLAGALQLLENPRALPSPRPLGSAEARLRMARGERPMIARAAADGITCEECGQLLRDHPVEISRPEDQPPAIVGRTERGAPICVHGRQATICGECFPTDAPAVKLPRRRFCISRPERTGDK